MRILTEYDAEAREMYIDYLRDVFNNLPMPTTPEIEVYYVLTQNIFDSNIEFNEKTSRITDAINYLIGLYENL